MEGRCFASALSSTSVSLLNLQFYQGKYEAGGGVGGGVSGGIESEEWGLEMKIFY